MKKMFIVCMGILTLAITACKNDSSVDLKEQDKAHLDQLLKEIKAIAQSVPCEEAGAWDFTPIGAKACGGPAAYIAYSDKIDTENFLDKVNQYTTLEKQFNKDWNIVSDCSVVAAPIGVICDEDQLPKLIYENVMEPYQ